jgi:hypothetical protein
MLHGTDVPTSDTAVLRRGVGSPSTWDLNRFELLAQEVLSCLPTAEDVVRRPDRPLAESNQSSMAQSDSKAAVHQQAATAEECSSETLRNGASPDAQPASGSSGGDREPADPGAGFPFTLVAALNLVLYQRQGYKHMARHGTPQCASLSMQSAAQDYAQARVELKA